MEQDITTLRPPEPDLDTLEAIYRSHGTALLRLAMALTGDRGTAEDLVQEAFVRFGTGVHAPEPGKHGAYLRRTVVNLARDRHRRSLTAAGTAAAVANQEVVGRTRTGWADPAATAVDAERQSAVLRAVDELPVRQRHCVVLTYYEELPLAETAELLDISVGSVKTHLHRARAALAEALEDQR